MKHPVAVIILILCAAALEPSTQLLAQLPGESGEDGHGVSSVSPHGADVGLPGPEPDAVGRVGSGSTGAQNRIPAFPGAQGFGSVSYGGRGPGGLSATPRIIYVTTLEDQVRDPVTGHMVTVPGSLRAAIEATGPRFVMFRVGGAIVLKSLLEIRNPHITIAGQTAPSPGIAICGRGLGVATREVVIRHLRFRPFIDEAAGEPLGGHQHDDALISKRDSEVQNPDTDAVSNVVFDHCSFSWSIDETIDIYNWVRELTFQWCTFTEASLYGHVEGPQGTGVLVNLPPTGPCPRNFTRLTIHHCLFAHNSNRNPRVIFADVVDFRNNVIYNWGRTPSQFYGTARINYIGNYLLAGLDVGSYVRAQSAIEVSSPLDVNGTPRLFVRDNLGILRTSSQQHDWDIGVYYSIRNDGTICPPNISNCYFEVRPDTLGGLYRLVVPAFAATVTTDPPETARDRVLQHAGATLPARDAVDQALFDELAYVVAARPFSGTNPGYDPATDARLRRLGPHHGEVARVLFFNPVFVSSHVCTPRTIRLDPFQTILSGQIELLQGLNCTFPDNLTLPDDYLEILARPAAYPWSLDTRVIPEARTIAGLYPANYNTPPRIDSDQDGIPNPYESITLHTNPFVADSLLDQDGDGYLNIEEYLNDLAD